MGHPDGLGRVGRTGNGKGNGEILRFFTALRMTSGVGMNVVAASGIEGADGFYYGLLLVVAEFGVDG